MNYEKSYNDIYQSLLSEEKSGSISSGSLDILRRMRAAYSADAKRRTQRHMNAGSLVSSFLRQSTFDPLNPFHGCYHFGRYSAFTDSHLAIFLESSKFPLKGSLFSSGPVPPFSRVVPSGDGYSDSVTVSRYDITLFNLTRPFDSVGHVSLLGDRGGVVSFRSYYLQFLCEIFDVPEITIRFYPFPSMVSVPGCGFAILAFTAVNELRFLSPKMAARHDKIFSSRFA